MFSFVKGTIRLKDIDTIEILTERNEYGIYLFLDAKLKNGKTRQIGGMRLHDEEKIHPKRRVTAVKLPSDKDWSSLKPDELTLNFGVVKATWSKKPKSSVSS